MTHTYTPRVLVFLWLCLSLAPLILAFSVSSPSPPGAVATTLDSFPVEEQSVVARRLEDESLQDIASYAAIMGTALAKDGLKGAARNVATSAMTSTSITAATVTGAGLLSMLASLPHAPYWAAWSMAQQNMEDNYRQVLATQGDSMLYGLFRALPFNSNSRPTMAYPLLYYITSVQRLCDMLADRMISATSYQSMHDLNEAYPTVSVRDLFSLEQFGEVVPQVALPVNHLIINKKNQLDYKGFYKLAQVMVYEMRLLGWDSTRFKAYFTKYTKSRLAEHFYTGIFDDFRTPLTAKDVSKEGSGFKRMYDLLDAQIKLFQSQYGHLTSLHPSQGQHAEVM